jgi:hypothetical protein
VNDDLERRLRAADPAPPTVPIDSARSQRARTLREQIMNDDQITLDPARSGGPRRRLLAAAAAAAVVVGGGIAVVSSGGDDTPADARSLALSVAADDPMQMCLEITPESVRSLAQIAFAGTVTGVEGEVVTLRVDRWFTGAEVDEVVVTSPVEGESALLGGVELETGGEYLISAADGAVQTCGVSGTISPELEAIYDEAFPG